MSKLLQQYKHLNAIVAVPSDGWWTAAFGRDLAMMMLACQQFKVGNYKTQHIDLYSITGSILTKSRLVCLKQALKQDADYLLFIDTDQTFPRKTLHLLISRQVDAIGANIPIKRLPSQPTARNKGATPRDWKTVYTDEGSTGIEKVDRIGTGILLISKKVMQALAYDCFDMFYRADIDDVQGEDWTLCNAIEDAGFPIYVDHDLSQEVGHVGLFEFKQDHIGEIVRQEDVGDTEPRKTSLVEALSGQFRSEGLDATSGSDLVRQGS